MIQIIKITIAFILAFFAYNYIVETTKTSKPKQKVVVNTIEKKKKSLFEPPAPPPKKEVVLFPEEGQVLTENQISFNTPEGKEEFKKQIGWLSDICDNYARKQWEIYNKKQAEIRKATLP